MRKLFFVPLFLVFLSFGPPQKKDLASWVNPMVGTDFHGHTFPGATVPFGMVQLSPDTRLEGWDGCSGYHYSDSVIYGFSHTHLSGTGCSDYGDILVMPVSKKVELRNYDYRSAFSHRNEKAEPGYYSVFLDDPGVQAELTVTPRTGYHRYTFPASGFSGIVFDLVHRDEVIESGLKLVSPTEIEGFRSSKAWAENQSIYFVARFSKPFENCDFVIHDKLQAGLKEARGTSIRSLFHFTTKKGEVIEVRVGISGTSIQGARKNLDQENKGGSFDKVRSAARQAWNRELSAIEVKGGSPEQTRTFYTALYHCMISPNLYSDVDGGYTGRDLKTHQTKDFNYYTVFSLWDTYRALHPLLTILEPVRTRDFIRTFLTQYQQGGLLPVWELGSNETNCMIGYHSVPVIADAWMKGIRGFDGDLALSAMQNSANQDHFGLKLYREQGFIPWDQEGEAVSRTLEYAFDDWCIATMAGDMGKTGLATEFNRRSHSWKNVFNPQNGFMCGRAGAMWYTPFEPAEVNFNYTEANAWQYSFYVPHDVTGLMQMHGGRDAFAGKLDAMFEASSKTVGREQADITGLIGQYAHGNEPSHHMAYLFNFAGQPFKTQKLVRQIMNDLYTDKPDGLCGNEDCGQMSAWYVFSAMGFYPVTPVSDFYALGSPLFEEITLRLPGGKSFTINARGNSNQNMYIQRARLNGQDYEKSYLRFPDLIKGGTLELEMGPAPKKSWASEPDQCPATRNEAGNFVAAPYISGAESRFNGSTTLSFHHPDPKATVFYRLEGEKEFRPYTSPLTIDRSARIESKAGIGEGRLMQSPVVSNKFTLLPKDRSIRLRTTYAPQYSAGGDQALIDQIRGGADFRNHTWQGYEGVDLDAVLDLGKSQTIHKISVGFAQQQGAWIFFPYEVQFFLSNDPESFRFKGTVQNSVLPEKPGFVAQDFSFDCGGTEARYIRVVGRNRGVCPPWHLGAGGKSWIFADEIVVE